MAISMNKEKVTLDVANRVYGRGRPKVERDYWYWGKPGGFLVQSVTSGLPHSLWRFSYARVIEVQGVPQQANTNRRD
ncbi:hypothetical protein AAZX31_20G058900 [Glycine max]